ncbi:MAG: exosome complex RNA-binding protein Rrp4 [Promethearchaeota archaeon]|jgi:exosome complex component RRP4
MENNTEENEIEEPEESLNNEDEEFEDFEDEEATRDVVVPGEVLTEDTNNFLPGRGTIYNTERTKIIALNIGLKQVKKNYINVIPLRGFYTPRPGDKVIALVVDKNPVKYKCDINAKDFGTLKPRNTMKRGKMRMGRGGGSYNQEPANTAKFDIGDVLIVKILSADRLNKPELTTVGKYLGKRNNGIVITIDPPKIPRVIGRNGSMIKMLKNLTNTNIFVTQNGRVWIKGEDIAHERLLIESIKKIASEAHTVGLTDRMQEYIINEKKKRGIK